MVQRLNEDTEPNVQRFFIEPYRETDMGAKAPAGVGLCV